MQTTPWQPYKKHSRGYVTIKDVFCVLFFKSREVIENCSVPIYSYGLWAKIFWVTEASKLCWMKYVREQDQNASNSAVFSENCQAGCNVPLASRTLFPFTMDCSSFSCPSQMNTTQSWEGIKHASSTETKKVLRTFEIRSEKTSLLTHLLGKSQGGGYIREFPWSRKRGHINSTDPAPFWSLEEEDERKLRLRGHAGHGFLWRAVT